MDAVASLYERNSLLDIVERNSAGRFFIPLCVGGGPAGRWTTSAACLRAGADKVSLNTARHRPPAPS